MGTSRRDAAYNGLAAAFRARGSADQLLIAALARLEAKLDCFMGLGPVPSGGFSAFTPADAAEIHEPPREDADRSANLEALLGWLSPSSAVLGAEAAPYTPQVPDAPDKLTVPHADADLVGNATGREWDFCTSEAGERENAPAQLLLKQLEVEKALTAAEEGCAEDGTMAEDPAISEDASFRCARCGDLKEEVELHWNEFLASWGGGVCDLCAEELQPENYAVSHTPEADDEHKRRVASYSTSRPSCSAQSVTQDPSPPTVITGTRTGKKRGRKKPKRTSQQVIGRAEDSPVVCVAADNSIEELLKSLTANGAVLAAFVEDLDSGRAVTDDEMAESCHSVLTGFRKYLETDGGNREILETWVHQLERLTPIIYARGRQPI